MGGVTIHEGRVLLARRSIPPAKGSWAIPGGYVESDETLEHAVVREVLEETAVVTEVLSLVSVRSVVKPTHLDTYIAFALGYVEGEATADGIENDDIGWFRLDELDELAGLTSSSKLLVGACAQGAKGLMRVPYSRATGEPADCFALPTTAPARR